jgi:hypothetical protein
MQKLPKTVVIIEIQINKTMRNDFSVTRAKIRKLDFVNMDHFVSQLPSFE